MKWLGRCLAMAACCAALQVHAALGATEDVLNVVPEDALAVAVVNRIGETQTKVEALGKQLKLPLAELLRSSPISVSTQPHLDSQGSLAIAAVPDPEAQRPTLVGFVPCRDYTAFIKQFQPDDADAKIAKITLGATSLVVAKKAGYAVITAEPDRKTLEHVLAETRSVAKATVTLSDWRASNDFYILAMPDGIRFAQQQLLIGLAMGKAQLAQQGEQAKAALAGLEMYENLFKSLDKEVTHCALGVQLRKDGGVQVVSRTLLAPGGVLLQAAQDPKVASEDLLAGLPHGPFVFAGGGVVPEGWMKRLMNVSVKMMKAYPGGAELTDEQAAKFAEISGKALQGVRSMGMLMGVGKADAPLYSDTVFVMRVTDSREYLERYARTIDELAKLGQAVKNPLFNYRTERMEIDGKLGLKVTMNMTAFLGKDQPPEAKKAMELMLGNQEELIVYIAAANPQTVIGAYLSRERLATAIHAAQQADGQLSGDAGVRKTIAMLLPGAQGVALASPQGCLQFVARMFSQLAPNLAPTIPEFPATSPVGFAMKLTPAGLETDLAIPADVLQTAAEVVQQARGPGK